MHVLYVCICTCSACFTWKGALEIRSSSILLLLLFIQSSKLANTFGFVFPFWAPHSQSKQWEVAPSDSVPLTLVTGWDESLVCSFYLSVAARTIVGADPSPRYTSMLLIHLRDTLACCPVADKQEDNKDSTRQQDKRNWTTQ